MMKREAKLRADLAKIDAEQAALAVTTLALANKRRSITRQLKAIASGVEDEGPPADEGKAEALEST